MKSRLLSICFFLIFISTLAYAQPSNNVCSAAITLPTNGTCLAGTLTAATPDAAPIGNTDCAGAGGQNNVWYTFVATNTAAVVNFTSANPISVAIGTFTGSACSSNFLIGICDNTSFPMSGLTVGTTYYVCVSGTSGAFEICLFNPPPPPPTNDNPCQAVTLPVCPAVSNGTTVGADAEFTNTICSTDGDEQAVWYQVNMTAPNSTLNLTFSNTTIPNISVSIFTMANCNNLNSGVSIVASRCFTGASSATFSGLTSGTTYYIQVSTASVNAGTFSICGTQSQPVSGCVPPVTNLTCTTAIPLVDNVCQNGCNTGAPTGPGPLTDGYACASAGPTVWYTFNTGTNTGANIFVSSGALLNPGVILISGSCTGTIVECNAGSSGAFSLIGQSLNPSTTYYIGVFDANAAEGVFEICVDLVPLISACSPSTTITETASSNPTTPPGRYAPGEQVTFCINVNGFNQGSSTGNNWIHGIVPYFGDCWTDNSFLPSGAPAVITTALVDAAGGSAATWGWWPAGSVEYNFAGTSPLGINSEGQICVVNDPNDPSCTTNLTLGTPMPGGWYVSGVQPGNPPNPDCSGSPASDPDCSWGDQGSGSGLSSTWRVCFRLTARNFTEACEGDMGNCTVGFAVFGDGQTGGWINNGCDGQFPVSNAASVNCCVPPDLDPIDPIDICTGGSASVSITCGGSICPTGTTYAWNAAATGGVTGASSCATGCGNFIAQTLNLPAAGSAGSVTYTITVTSATGCTSTTTAVVNVRRVRVTASAAPNPVCQGNDITLNTNITPSVGNYTCNWNNGIGEGCQVTIPANFPSYVVTVSDDSGCSATATVAVTVVGAVDPVVSSNKPTYCIGDTAILTVTGVPVPCIGCLYNWDVAGIGNNPRRVVITGAMPNPVNFCVTVTNGGGVCQGLSCVEVNITSAAGVTATSNSPVCVGQTINLMASGGTSYSWSGPASFTSSLQNPTRANATVAMSGNYTVTATSGTCSAVTTVAVVVSPGISAAASATPTSVCDGGITDLCATPTGAGYIYSWANGVGTNIGATQCLNDYVVANAPETFRVTVTDGVGCSGTATVTVTETPSFTVSTNTPAPVCSGDCPTLQVTAPTGAGITYLWPEGVTTASYTPTVCPTSNISYVVTVTNSGGCSATRAVSVTVNPPPVALVMPSPVNVCEGANFTTTASGGTMYTWSGPSTFSASTASINRTNVTAAMGGTYYVTVTNASGCSSTTTVEVNVRPKPRPVIAQQTIGCNQIRLTANPTPGDATYSTYGWSTPPGGSTSNVVVTTIVGNPYIVTVTDANGCSSTDDIVVAFPATLDVVCSTVSPETSTCNGIGHIAITGGTAPYSYTINAGASTPIVGVATDINNLCSGAHIINVTDANGCTATCTINIPPAGCSLTMTSNTVSTPIACFGEMGGITFAFSGGTAPFTYSFQQGANTPINGNSATSPIILNNLLAGNYSITISDSRLPSACTIQSSVNLTQPTDLTVSGTIDSIECFGNTGGVSLSVSGGMPTYSYNWSPSGMGINPTGLSSGNYSVTVTDMNTCTETAMFNLTQPTDLLLACNLVSDVTVIGASDGVMSITISGGIAPYDYNWSCPTADTVMNVTAGTYQITGLPSGTCSVTVTDANGCTEVCSVTFTTPGCTIGVSGTSENTSCSNTCDGTIDLTITGAIATPTIDWNPSSLSGEDQTGLCAGTYVVTVSELGCTTSTTFTITSPQALSLTCTPQPISAIGLSDGSLDVSVTGGTATYTVNWSNGGAISGSQAGVMTTHTISNLPAGTYGVTVTDANGCSTTCSSIVNSAACLLSVAGVGTDATCNGSDDGTVTITMTNGTGPYDCQFSNLQNITTATTTATITNLPAGQYCVIVTDANNCTATNCIIVSEPMALNINCVATPASLPGVSDGELALTFTGGTSNYDITWDGTSSGSQLDISGTTYTITNLAAGSYSISVTDANGCVDITNCTVTEPGCDLALSEMHTDITCNGVNNGTIDILITGTNNLPYTVAWTPSSLGTQTSINQLPAGDYSVTVTINGTMCSRTLDITLTEPSALVSNCVPLGISAPNQTDGKITVNIMGGVAPYDVVWTGGTLQNDIPGTTYQILNLAAGSYTVTVTDDNGCTTTCVVDVPSQNCALTLSAILINALCNGDDGCIDITPNGGTAPYNYVWDNGNTNAQLCTTGSGNFCVTVTDANNCTASVCKTLTSPPPLTLSGVMTVEASIISNNDGEMSITFGGGVAPYKYAWSCPQPNEIPLNPAGTYTITGLPGGQCCVTVTDANDCEIVECVLITIDGCDYVTGTMNTTEESLCGDGCITVNYNTTGEVIANGVRQFIIHDSPGGTIGNVIATSNTSTICFDDIIFDYDAVYYVSAVVGITDGNGDVDLTNICTVNSEAVPIVWHDFPTATIASPMELSCSNDTITISGSGIGTGLTYAWTASNAGSITGNTNTANIQATSAGTYTLTVTGAGSCTATASTNVVDISNTFIAQISASPTANFDCTVSTITLTGTVTGTNNPVTYTWYQSGLPIGSGDELDVTPSNAGQIDLTVVDMVTGCSDSETITISTSNSYPGANAGEPDQMNCLVTSIILTGSSGFPIPNLIYSWTLPDNTVVMGNTLNNISTPGNYIFTVIDTTNNCTSMDTVTVQPPNVTPPTANAGTNVNLDCNTTPINLVGSVTGTNNATYSWTSVEGNPIQNPNSNSPTIANVGTYTLLVTDLTNFCTDTDDVVIGQDDGFAANVTSLSPTCFGDNNGVLIIDVPDTSPPYIVTVNGTDYGSTNIVSFLAAGQYIVSINDANGCNYSETYNLAQPQQVEVALGPDLTMEYGDSVMLQAQINLPPSQLDTIIWTPNDLFNCLDPEPCYTQLLIPQNQVIVSVTVFDTSGCFASDDISIIVKKTQSVFIPNIFTPNNDGFNDIFYILGGAEVAKVNKFKVFDRWGELMYQADLFAPNDPQYGWDGKHRGKPMNPAVFVYWAELQFTDGSVKFFKGDVTLIR